jgi:hypothetical protein
MAGLRIRIHMDPHYFWWLTPDSDPHWSEKLDRIRIKVKLQKLSRLKKNMEGSGR